MFERPGLTGGTSGAVSTDALSIRGGEDFDPVMLWNSLLGILTRRWILFVAVFLAFTGAVAVAALRTPKEYTTEVRFIAGSANAQNGQPQTGLPVLNAIMLANAAQSAETYTELIGETPVVQTVIADLQLHTSIARLKAAISVKPITDTNIISLTATWSDPQTSAKIANDFANVFVSRESDLVSGQANGALLFLSKQLPAAQQRLRKASAEVSSYEKAHKIADIVGQTNSTVEAGATLDSKINAIRVEKKQADSQIASLGSQLASMQPVSRGGQSVAENPVLPQLRAQLAQVEIQLGSAKQLYTDSYPTVINLKQQVADLKRQIASQAPTVVAQTNTIANPVFQQLSQQLAAARATSVSDTGELGVLLQQRRDLDQQVAQLPAVSANVADLRRKEKVAEDIYTALQAKYNDAVISKSTGISDVTITQPALAELALKKPSIALNVAIGVIVGLLLALGAVLLADWFDSRIRNESDVEGELHLPVLAMVPDVGGRGKRELAVPDWTLDAEAEAYDNLVLEMRYSKDPDKKLHVLTVTSPVAGDGKSTVAMKLAGVFGETAELSGSDAQTRVLIIDADMRRPSLHLKFGLPNVKGLSDILVGAATLTQCVQRTDRQRVDLLTSGTLSRNPVKLLQSSHFDRLLAEARSLYTVVVVDAPALVPVADAAVAAVKSDGTLLVLSAGESDFRTTRRALQRLERIGNAEIIGVVINRAKLQYDEFREYAQAPVALGSETSHFAGGEKADAPRSLGGPVGQVPPA